MIHAIDAHAMPQGSNATAPYPPSFLDRFMDAVKRLPIPYGLTYLLLFVAQSAAFHILSWIDGWLPAYTFSTLLLVFPLWLWGPLAIMTYLNCVAREAVAAFAPLLDVEQDVLRRLDYEFTTMPARGVILSSLGWSAVYVVLSYVTFQPIFALFHVGATLAALHVIQGLISFSAGSAVYYHSVRQLGLVHRTVRTVQQFDLFRLDPVYAFSILTSRTGVAWIMLLALTMLMFPIQLAAVPILALMVVQVVLAISALVLPLRIVSLRLVAEKRRLLAELDQRVKTILARLHRCLDNNDLADAAQLNDALAGLNAERDILATMPTWPWRAGMLPRFLSVVVFPIVLLLIQLALAKWLGE